MKNLTLTIFLLTLVFTAFSQTKKIAHLSHSGSNESFIAANYIDNLGNPPDMWRVDSIIKINDSTIVEVSYNWNRPGPRYDTLKYEGEFYQIDSTIYLENSKRVQYKSGVFTGNKIVDTINYKQQNSYCAPGFGKYPVNYKHVNLKGFEKEKEKENFIPISNLPKRGGKLMILFGLFSLLLILLTKLAYKKQSQLN